VRDVLETHLPYVYRFALQLAGDPDAARDIAQETMLRAWRHRRRLRDKQAARQWLLAIAVNVWRDELRRRRRHPVSPIPASGDPPAHEAPASQVLTRREAIALVKLRMAQLPPRQREVLYLRAFEKLSLKEIAGVLSIGVNAVKVNLWHARQSLRRTLSQYDPGREIHR
jgi:RNA polymerase sigma-70 factor (ECF subfamily)